MNGDINQQIEKMIYVIRNQKVMIDSDLAKIYGVSTKSFNQSVKRNLYRFPDDFMFQLNSEEHRKLVASSGNIGKYGGTRFLPFAFTECGVAMLSSVLTSREAALINITIMRTFVKMRSFLAIETIAKDKVENLERTTNHLFKIVFERLDTLEEEHPPLDPKRRKIGLNNNINN